MLGPGGVMLFDINNAYDDTGDYFALQDVRMNYLTHGDKVVMRIMDIKFDSRWADLDLTYVSMTLLQIVYPYYWAASTVQYWTWYS